MSDDYVEIICIKECTNMLNNFIFIKGNTYKAKFDYIHMHLRATGSRIVKIFTMEERLIMNRTIESIEPFKRFPFYEHFIEKDVYRDHQIDLILLL